MIRKRFFAWFLRKSDEFNHKIYGPIKAELFQKINGQAVEIGPGTGVNLEYLPKDTEWLGIEPNALFWPEIFEKAKTKGIEAKIIKGDPSTIELPDNSVDVVLVTLVLCSVNKPEKMVGAIKRILKSGGQFI